MSVLKKSELVFAPLSTNYNFVNLTGKKFGRLRILGYGGRKNRRSLWYCECDCGAIRVVDQCNLNTGRTVSCGCYHSDELGDRKRTKAFFNKTEYSSYASAKGRCLNPKDRKYPNYGGRGIKFLYKSFEEFLADLGKKTKVGRYTLDRIDNNSHYMPGNCRWANPKTQGRNTRQNKIVTIDGTQYKLVQFFPEVGSRAATRAHGRLGCGWSAKAAIFAPNKMKKSDAEKFVAGKSLEQLAKEMGRVIPPVLRSKRTLKKDAAA